MDRYWRALETEFKRRESAAIQVSGPLGAAPENSHRGSRLARAWQKYAAYPIRCRFLPPTDVVHLLDHSFAHLLKYLPKEVPVVATLHDVAPLIERGSLSDAQIERFRETCLQLDRADLILCDSQATVTDAVRLLGLPAGKLKVLLLGVDYHFFHERQPLARVELAVVGNPTLLSVGTIQSRKNLQILPSILAKLVASGLKPVLWRAGQLLPPPLKLEIESVIGAERLVEFGFVSNEELRALYQRASVFVMPSTLEGFGLPVIEAMAAECPVVCSTGGSLAEVAGGAALLFDPQDAETAANHLRALAENIGLVKELNAKGLLWAESLSWSAHLDRLEECYRSVQK